MKILIGAAALLAGVILGARMYLKIHPPEMCEAHVRRLYRGSTLGIVSSCWFLCYSQCWLFILPCHRRCFGLSNSVLLRVMS